MAVDSHHGHSRKAWYLLHSWSGAVLGLALYALFVSGSLLLFQDQLQSWQYPELRGLPSSAEESPQSNHPTTLKPIHFENMVAQAQASGLIDDTAVFYLTPGSDGVILRQGGQIAVFEPHTGDLLGVHAEGATPFLRTLHADLLLPFPLGLFSSGLLGMALLLLVITGLVVHRRFYLHLFTWRRRQFRLAWADAHKLIGTWGALFYALMGLSGAILGLISIYMMITASAAYPGGAADFDQMLKGPRVEASGQSAPLPDINTILHDSLQRAPAVKPEFVTLRHIGDANLQVVIEGVRPGSLSALARKIYNVQGELVHVVDDVGQGVGLRAYVTLMALHFADFGGLPVRLLYLVLGLGSAFLPVSGVLLWLHRREQRLQHHGVVLSSAGTSRLSRLCAAFAVGLPTAIAAVFAVDRMGWNATSMLFLAFTVTLGTYLMLALRIKTLRSLWRVGIGLCGLSWLTCAVMDVARFGMTPGVATQINLVFALIGIACFGVVWRLRQPATAQQEVMAMEGEPREAR